jgi:hypothetical protein
MIQCKIVCQKSIFTDFFFYIEKLGPNSTNLLLLRATRLVSTAKPTYSIKPINHSGDDYRCGATIARFSANMSKRKFKLELTKAHVNNLLDDQIMSAAYTSFTNEPTQVAANLTLCNGSTGSARADGEKLTYFLRNVRPHYDPERKKFVLSYNGRAKRSSKHNFQMVNDVSPEATVMQLGKIDTFIFNCDYTFPLCALQAFAFGISSLAR